jgi:hypothetical protein
LAEILLAAVEEIFVELIERLGYLWTALNAQKRWRSHRAAKAEGLAAADKLDNFQAVACGYAGFLPFGFGQDFEVVFDGYATGVESQMVEKGAHTGAGRQLFRFPVDVNVNCFGHDHIILQERGVSHAVKTGGARCSCSLPRE